MENKPKALMLASVASMIDLFNMDNISILKELGFRVDVATNFEFGSITSQERVNEFRKELEKDGIRTFQIPIPRSLFRIHNILDSYKKVKVLVNSNEYSIVHCHSPIGGCICRLACRKARKIHETKVIYTAHGFHFFKGASIKAWLLFYPIEKFLSRFTDLLITINHEDCQAAKKFHAKKTEYVPGIGIHTEAFRNVCVDKRSIRKQLGINDDDYVFMSTGQLSVRKNHEVIIRALSKIDKANVKYLIVGLGELDGKLRDLVEELGLKHRVIFAGYRSDVKQLLHAVDAYAFPSLQEGLPASLMEAMAVGLPIVCSKIRGNVDLIENGQGGYLYDAYDIDGFAEGMTKIMLSDNQHMKAININTMKNFDTNVVNQKMKSMYLNL